MNHLGTQRLETDRIILRPFTVEDAPAMYRNWASDPEVTRFLTWPPHANVGVTEFVLRDWVSHYGEPEYYQWAMELKSIGEPVGSIAVVNSQAEGKLSIAEVGYCLGKAWWGQGLMPEAARAVRDFLFDRVGYDCIQAGHDVNNPKSGRVMQKVGMTRAGILRHSGLNNQGLADIVRYDMLSTDPRP